jgi:hypothetical protein
MRRRFENNAKLYEYKIVSNCIGGGGNRRRKESRHHSTGRAIYLSV